jgi:Dullard-like phosphatase family protein
LSDKEKIDDYYEYCDLCFETLKEINLKEVPKSKSKINFKFPKERQNKKIALFDLDETLVHCTGEIKNDNNPENNKKIKTQKVKVVLPNKKEIFIGINIRPHWKESLDKIKDVYNIVIFTASHQSYSDAVLNYLDPENKYFNYRLYRDSCVQCKTNDINFYVKDLDIFKDNYDLKDIIMIDNSILSFAYHLDNGIPVVPFYDSTEDSELPLLAFYLLSISSYKDLRVANKEHINMQYLFSNNQNEKYSQNEEDINEKSEIEYKKECYPQNSIIIKSNKEVNNIIIGEFEKNDEVNKRRRSNSVATLDKNKRNSKINNDINKSNKANDSINFQSISAKKLYNILSVSKKESKLTIFNAMKGESSKINVDFLQKWKNAYLKLSLKK